MTDHETGNLKSEAKTATRKRMIAERRWKIGKQNHERHEKMQKRETENEKMDGTSTGERDAGAASVGAAAAVGPES